MRTHTWIVALGFLAVTVALAAALTQHDQGMKEHVLQNEADVKWSEPPPFLPPGAKVCILEGNPAEAKMFGLRVKLPANYRIPAHSHPSDEHVVVLSGALYMGMGDKLDESVGKALKAGGFALMPARQNHFAYTKSETMILVYGLGPVEFKYVNPGDDPRNRNR